MSKLTGSVNLRATMLRRLRLILTGIGLLTDRGHWLEPDRLIGCAYPRRETALAALARQGVSVLINLHERAHDPERLARHGLTEVHLPVPDFTPPSPEQLRRGLEAMEQAIAAGRAVAVHCGGGLGRTGTLLACYLVRGGLNPADAIAQVRRVRPGSVETPTQVATVETFAASDAAHRGHATSDDP
jgi:atypical dual specificity phosphatase